MSVEHGIGCYGAPLVYSDKQERCQRCKHKTPCRESVIETLGFYEGEDKQGKTVAKLMKDNLGIKFAYSLDHLMKSATEYQERMVGKLTKNGIDPRREIVAGRNPFNTPRHVALVVESLIERPHTREELRMKIGEQLGGSLQTVSNRLSESISLLMALDLVESHFDVIIIRGRE